MPKLGDIALTDIISVVVAVGSLIFAIMALPDDASSTGSSSSTADTVQTQTTTQ